MAARTLILALVCSVPLAGCLWRGGEKGDGEIEDGEVGGLDGADGGDTDRDGDGVPADEDCDDDDPDAFPGADERCNGLDDDCDGEIDEDGAVDAPGWYYDADGDGYGTLDDVTYACEQPPAHTDDPRDCDDTRAEISPSAQERCDGIDNDCDELVDAADDSLGGDTADWYTDADGDGHGDDDSVVISCTQPAGTVASGGDCDDGNPTIHPYRAELCDGIDQDCDGIVDNDPIDGGALYYPDADGDSWGDADLGARACTPPSGRINRGGDCDDSRAAVNPDEPEVCGDGLDNDCSGDAAGCLILGDHLLTSDYDLRMVGEGTFDYAGGAVALMADVSGDGVVDIAVGASGDDDGATGAGAVYIVRGTRTGAQALASANGKIVGESSNDQAGKAVAGLGDVDGDGVGDLVLGAPFNNAGGTDRGAAYLVLGPVTGTLDMSVDSALKMTGATDLDYAGRAVAAGGDVDGDGVIDLIVGARGSDLGGASGGAVYIVASDHVGRLRLNAADAVLVGEAAGDLAGDAVAGGRDLDGDGLNDVAVGARQSSPGGSASGGAYLLYGPLSGTIDLADAELTLSGQAANDAAGTSVALTGDVTGDGLPDLLVGATGHDAAGTGAGAAYVFAGGTTGSLSLAAADAKLLGRVGGENLGGTACAAGDTDGDGLADVAVGAEGHNSGRGAVYLYSGPLSGTVAGLDATSRIRGHAAGDRVGACSGGLDVNGDGLDDLLLGAEGNDITANYAGAAWLLRPEAP